MRNFKMTANSPAARESLRFPNDAVAEAAPENRRKAG